MGDISYIFENGAECRVTVFTVFPATLEIRENLDKQFPIFQSGKTQGNCDSDPDRKGFHQFGVCASCAMCPSCVH